MSRVTGNRASEAGTRNNKSATEPARRKAPIMRYLPNRSAPARGSQKLCVQIEGPGRAGTGAPQLTGAQRLTAHEREQRGGNRPPPAQEETAFHWE